jgi:hypothetical protein
MPSVPDVVAQEFERWLADYAAQWREQLAAELRKESAADTRGATDAGDAKGPDG